MPSEVELKFACPEDALAALAEHERLRDALETDEARLVATYFDTPEQDLAAARLSCRIRRRGSKRVQTVKADDGVAARHEWECDLDDDALDLARLPKSRANALLRRPKIAQRLASAFTVEVNRRSFAIAQGATLVEISLDRGWIAAGDGVAPICEAEFELKEGQTRDLFALARDFVRDYPLTLDPRSKSERGSRLLAGREGVETETPHPPLSAEMSFPDGFRALCLACLRPIANNAPLLAQSKSPDALHQTRTSVRRLRAVLAIFKRHVRDAAYDDLREELKWLSRRLGAARDLDVAGQRWAAQEATAPLVGALEQRRDDAYDAVLDALASPRYRLLLLDFVEWLACGSWTTRPPKKRSRGSFADVWLLEALRWDKRLCEAGAQIREMDADERHAVRIRAKSFHYVVDLTESLIPRRDRAAHKAYRKRLKAFQSALGEANDARVAGDLLAELDLSPDLDAAARRAARRKPRRGEDLVATAEKAYAKFAKAARPWSA